MMRDEYVLTKFENLSFLEECKIYYLYLWILNEKKFNIGISSKP